MCARVGGRMGNAVRYHGCSCALTCTPCVPVSSSHTVLLPVSAPAGRGRPLLRAHPDHLVRQQGARHVLGHVEHRAQPGRLRGAAGGGRLRQGHGLEVGHVSRVMRLVIAAVERCRHRLSCRLLGYVAYVSVRRLAAHSHAQSVAVPACVRRWAPGIIGLVVGAFVLLVCRWARRWSGVGGQGAGLG